MRSARARRRSAVHRITTHHRIPQQSAAHRATRPHCIRILTPSPRLSRRPSSPPPASPAGAGTGLRTDMSSAIRRQPSRIDCAPGRAASTLGAADPGPHPPAVPGPLRSGAARRRPAVRGGAPAPPSLRVPGSPSGAALRASPVRRAIRRPAVGPAAGVLIRSASGRPRAGPSAPRASGPPGRRRWRRRRCGSAPRLPCGSTGVLRRAGCA